MKARLLGRWLVALTVVCTVVAVAPAIANASTVWVSHEPPKAPFNKCATPAYNSVQQAINANVAGTVIHICSGSYQEQVTIEKAVTLTGEAGTVLEYPASPANGATACKFAHAGQTEVAEVEICTTEAVKILGTTVKAVSTEESCLPELFGVTAGGGVKLTMTHDTVIGPVEPAADEGCQSGVGIQVGRKAAGTAATATLTEDSVSAYNKNGITVDGPGSKATIKLATITHAASPITANNGIQISRGAVGKVIEAKISGNECNAGVCGPSGLTETQATGVLLFEAAPGSTVSKSNIAKNDIAIYNYSAAETTKPQAVFTSDTLTENRYEGVLLDQGYATVNKTTIAGPANVGIELIQYEGQEFGPRGTGNEDTITNMSVHAVEGLSDLQPADQFGSFKITLSQISNNPTGASVSESVFTNNPSKLPIITTGSDT